VHTELASRASRAAEEKERKSPIHVRELIESKLLRSADVSELVLASVPKSSQIILVISTGRKDGQIDISTRL